MSTVYEIADSGRGGGSDENPTWELRYNVEDAADEYNARVDLLAESPVFLHGLVRDSADVDPIGPAMYEGTVRYIKRKKEEGQFEFEFEFGSESVRRTHAIATRNTYTASGFTMPDYKGAIGVVVNGGEISIEGCEVDSPALTFSIRGRLAPSAFTSAYRAAIAGVKHAPVNNAPFLGFAANEVRFLGCTGGYKEGDPYGELQFRFAVSPNVTDLYVGGIGPIAKKGWDFLDIYCVKQLDATANAMVDVPKAVRCHQVYYESNFAALGIA
jgi:hypothetical protein